MTSTYQQPAFLAELDRLIVDRRKMTSPLYQRVLAGEASLPLLQAFVIHRYPIKAFWTRNILGIASRIDDYALRCELIENIYEEETGALTKSKRHLETFVDFGRALGLAREDIVDAPEMLPETEAVIRHNVGVCNRSDVHFTQGVASVLLLMEGQPPIVSADGRSMSQVMRETYRLPPAGWLFFHHHASSTDADHVSELEDDHASTARTLLYRFCTTDALRQGAIDALQRAIALRHAHFDAILACDPAGVPFRHDHAAA
ncbi:MAG: iron-containing redox enzyme family protein [Alphaproteobacteria bacterium]|nr:iron-containing redox enzyme family protein [Alphaproteobacteria bacterium]